MRVKYCSHNHACSCTALKLPFAYAKEYLFILFINIFKTVIYLARDRTGFCFAKAHFKNMSSSAYFNRQIPHLFAVLNDYNYNLSDTT